VRRLVEMVVSIPVIESIVRASRLADAEALVQEALTLKSEVEVRQLVEPRMRESLPPDAVAWTIASDG
jgi:hypothetical protein